jgi:hypothetical protein
MVRQAAHPARRRRGRRRDRGPGQLRPAPHRLRGRGIRGEHPIHAPARRPAFLSRRRGAAPAPGGTLFIEAFQVDPRRFGADGLRTSTAPPGPARTSCTMARGRRPDAVCPPARLGRRAHSVRTAPGQRAPPGRMSGHLTRAACRQVAWRPRHPLSGAASAVAIPATARVDCRGQEGLLMGDRPMPPETLAAQALGEADPVTGVTITIPLAAGFARSPTATSIWRSSPPRPERRGSGEGAHCGQPAAVPGHRLGRGDLSRCPAVRRRRSRVAPARQRPGRPRSLTRCRCGGPGAGGRRPPGTVPGGFRR